MRGFETVIEEFDVSDNAKPVCQDGELVGITEMPVLFPSCQLVLNACFQDLMQTWRVN